MSEKRFIPTNELDLQMQLTNSEWGEKPKSEQLGSLTQDFSITYKKGTKIIINQELSVLKDDITIISDQGAWGKLAYLTKDIRLANLTTDEVKECNHLLDLAGDCLSSGYNSSFSVAIMRVAHILEVSQSRKGFTRKILNTFRQENIRSDLNPPKSKLFGGRKNTQGDY